MRLTLASRVFTNDGVLTVASIVDEAKRPTPIDRVLSHRGWVEMGPIVRGVGNVDVVLIKTYRRVELEVPRDHEVLFFRDGELPAWKSARYLVVGDVLMTCRNWNSRSTSTWLADPSAVAMRRDEIVAVESGEREFYEVSFGMAYVNGVAVAYRGDM